MRKILERYIAKTLFQATGMAALVIISILILITMLGELKNVGQGDYGLFEAAAYVFMKMPNLLYQFSPLLVLLGCVIGLNTLSTYRELSIMRASSFSSWQIIRTVLFAALLMIMGITLVGEYIGPSLSYKAETRKENAQHGGQAVVTSAGVWLHVENNFINIRHVVGQQLLQDVSSYEFDQQQHLLAAYFARTLQEEAGKWTMHDVTRTTFTYGATVHTKSETFTTLPWKLKFNPTLLRVGMVDPEEMSLPRLADFYHYLENNQLQANEYKYNFWQRIFQPLSSTVMVFLAVPIVLGSRERSTLGRRILGAILAGFAFFILNALLGQLCIVFQLPTIAAAALPPLLFGAVGLVYTRRSLN